jgi:hypothetical protein
MLTVYTAQHIIQLLKKKTNINPSECFCTLSDIVSYYAFFLGKMLFYYWIQLSSFIDFFFI